MCIRDRNTLLASVWSAPLPRKVVRLVPLTDDGKVAPGERKALILERMAKGEKQAAIARDLGLSPSLINKILKGVRQ